jgi:hypothetical protein
MHDIRYTTFSFLELLDGPGRYVPAEHRDNFETAQMVTNMLRGLPFGYLILHYDPKAHDMDLANAHIVHGTGIIAALKWAFSSDSNLYVNLETDLVFSSGSNPDEFCMPLSVMMTLNSTFLEWCEKAALPKTMQNKASSIVSKLKNFRVPVALIVEETDGVKPYITPILKDWLSEPCSSCIQEV